MRLALALVCAALVSAGPARAAERPALASERSDKIEIVARIREAVDACNRHDVTALTGYLMPLPIVMDQVPPYQFQGQFQGTHAFPGWETSYDADSRADSRKNAITEPEITLLRVKDIEITGTHAYVVWPAAYGFKQAGKRSEHYSTITVALEKSGRDWRIATWILNME